MGSDFADISVGYVGQSSFQVSFYLWLLWARSLWSAAYDARKKNHIYFPSSILPFFLLFYPWSCPPLHVFTVTQSCLILLSLQWTVAHQAPLSMGFPRQEYGVGSHFLLQGIFPTQELNPCLLHCRQILYRWAIWETPMSSVINIQFRVESLMSRWMFSMGENRFVTLLYFDGNLY